MESLELLWVLVCACLFPLTILYFVYFRQVTSILEKRHKEDYKNLGEMGFIKNNTIVNSSRFMIYILLGEYVSLEDQELNGKANLCRWLLFVGILLFLIAFLLPVYIGNYG